MPALLLSIVLWLLSLAYLVVLYRGAKARERDHLEHRSAVMDRLEDLKKAEKELTRIA